jgi:hypothetical protein
VPAPAAPAKTAAPPTTLCPPCEQDSDNTEGFGALNVGLAFFDLSSLDDRLRAAGYETIAQPLFLIGGEARAVLESGLVIGGRGAGILTGSGDGPGEVRSHFGGGFGMADFGFAFVHTEHALLTLTGGVGGYGLSLELTDEQDARFDEVLANPMRSASLAAGGFLFGATAGFDGRIPFGKVERRRRPFFTIGVRLGALVGAPGEWSLPQGADARRGPDDVLTGAYGLLSLGFGGAVVERAGASE